MLKRILRRILGDPTDSFLRGSQAHNLRKLLKGARNGR